MHENSIRLLIAFDFGLKKIGLATGQLLTGTSTPLTTLQAKNGVPDWDKIINIISEWQPDALIIGIPYNMDGSEQPMTQKARQFASQLKNRYHLPVFEMDERLTSAATREAIYEKSGYKGLRKQSIDQGAAALILEQWMKNYLRRKTN